MKNDIMLVGAVAAVAGAMAHHQLRAGELPPGDVGCIADRSRRLDWLALLTAAYHAGHCGRVALISNALSRGH